MKKDELRKTAQSVAALDGYVEITHPDAVRDPDLFAALQEIAACWLDSTREHEDNDAPPTPEWLRDVIGFKPDDEEPYLWINGPDQEIDVQYWTETGEFNLVNVDALDRITVKIATRRQLRQMLAAFGIVTKEGRV